MNINTYCYAAARKAMHTGDNPGVLQIIDRLRFLAKNDRSKYKPHQGAKECDRRNASLAQPLCVYSTYIDEVT